MQEILSIEKQDRIITERPKAREDGLEQLEDVCQNAKNQIQDIRIQYISELSNKIDENDIYGTLEPLIKRIGDTIEEFFDESLKKFNELHEFVRENSQYLHNIAEENISNKNGGDTNADINLTGSTNPSNNASGIINNNINVTNDNHKSDKEIEESSNIVDSIFITGNGFDRAHKIESGYEDFKRKIESEWKLKDKLLEKHLVHLIQKAAKSSEQEEKDIEQFIRDLINEDVGESDGIICAYAIIETLNENDVKWIEFEDTLNFKDLFVRMMDALEKIYNIENIYPIDNEYRAKINKDIYQKLQIGIIQTISTLKNTFNEWIISLENAVPVFDEETEKEIRKRQKLLDELKQKNCLFATYNYTHTLENVYNIDNVYHIHGEAGKNNELIVGFCDDKSMDDYVKIIYKGEDANYLDEVYEGSKGNENWVEKYVDVPNIEISSGHNDIKNKASFLYEYLNSTKQDNSGNKVKMVYNPENVMNFGRLLNELRKKCDHIIEDYPLFKKEENEKNNILQHIKNLYIYGWAINIPDYPYLMKIFESTKEKSLNVYLSEYEFNNDFEKIAGHIKGVNEILKNNGIVGKEIKYYNMEDKEKTKDDKDVKAIMPEEKEVKQVINKNTGETKKSIEAVANQQDKTEAGETKNAVFTGADEVKKTEKENESSKEKNNTPWVHADRIEINYLVKVVEIIVKNGGGVNEINKCVDKHHSLLDSNRKVYSSKRQYTTQQKNDITSDKYGKYMVTKRSVQDMYNVCGQVNTIMEPIDKFYKEKFKTLDERFQKANAMIHTLSSFLTMWGLGTCNLSNLFKKDESETEILKKIQLGGLALAASNTAGLILNGGAFALKLMDWAMPHLKKSNTLIKLNEKFWKLTRQDIQIPYEQRMMDMYMMEHYELKLGNNKIQSIWFEYYHAVAIKIEDEKKRRTFENSIFAAELLMRMRNYKVNESSYKNLREMECGIFLNLVRAGMCIEQNIDSNESNKIVDELYNCYVRRENIKPRVGVNPDKLSIN